MHRKYCLLFVLLIILIPTFTSARVYDDEHPLIYEDAWDLWPYSFVNDTGEPTGFNIDLLKLIFNELDIPYKVKLKPTQDALNDLKEGKADLMCGMDAHFHNEYAQYGKSVIQIFTHSIVHHKGEPVLVKSVDDLATQRVIVHDGSFSHHLMEERGWGKNAIPYNDMQEAVQFVHNHKDHQIAWNTLSLKWLLHKFSYDDLELTPVNIPHGEYKFMSNDPRLLEQIDSVFAKLNSEGRLQPIQNKWFYPEHKETGIPSSVWYVVAALLTVIVIFLIYYIFSRFYERKMTSSLRHTNNRLALILNTSKVHIWIFDVATKMLTSIDQDGKKESIPISTNFIQFYIFPDDYERLTVLIGELIAKKKERETMDFNAVRKSDKTRHIFSVDISVMKHDKNGNPTVLIGATTDITDLRQRQQEQKNTLLRYQYIFNSALVDTVSYNEHGILDRMNNKATVGVGGHAEQIIDKHITVQDVIGEPDLTLDELDYTYVTQIYKSRDDERALNRILKRDELYYELQLVPIRDDEERLLGIIATGRDVTEIAKSYSSLQKKIAKLQEANDELQDYMRNIDYILKNGGVRIVDYSPDTHMLTVYSEIEHVQYQLTQTRLLSLTAEESKNTARRIMNTMDSHTRQPVKAVVKSTIRIKDNKPLCMSFSFVPVTDAEGHVTNYFGMCRDISEIKATEERLAMETRKAQEVEEVKNAFLHNMCHEIRTPLNSVIGFADLIEHDHSPEDEPFFVEEIKKNTRSLLTLVNNILLLSRLDAGMIEYKPEPVDFASFFEGRCQSAWMYIKQPGVDYVVDTPYEHLTLNIDMTNMGVIIDQIISNAVQHTTSGYVRARFDYNGEDLTVAVQDTGCGIPADQTDRIFERFVTTDSNSSGLGLPICQEIVKLMGGKIRFISEVGKGTVVWIIIPCSISEVVKVDD